MKHLISCLALVCLLGASLFGQTTPIHKLDAKGPAVFDHLLSLGSMTFAQVTALGAVADSAVIYCNNCTQTTPAASGGAGAMLRRVAGVWVGSDGAGGGGSSAFAALTSGTNVIGAFLIGSGSSLGTTGGGTIQATTFTGTLAGDVSGTQGVTVVNKVNGTTVPTNLAADQVHLSTAPAVSAWATVPGCLDAAGNHLNYNTATHAFSCGSTSGGAGAGVAPGTATFSSTQTWTVPAGVIQVRAEAWGGGGGGTAGYFTSDKGGGGGGYAAYWCTVTPGAGVTVTVGAGGTGGVAGGASAGSGGTSSFGACVLATGGGPWMPGLDARPAAGSSMYYDLVNGGTYDWNYINANQGSMPYGSRFVAWRADSGGFGAPALNSAADSVGFAGNAATWGGGGGGAGSRGTVASPTIGAGPGGVSGYGGAGGNGGAITAGAAVACTAGSVPGGGGGGGGWNGSTNTNGCAGGAGQVNLRW